MLDNFELIQILICIAAIALGGLVQTSIGFGMGLVSGPIMLEAGLNLVQTVTILLISTILQCSHSVYKLRCEVPFKLILSFTPLRIAGMVLGVYFLHRFALLDPQTVKQIVGVVLLCAVAAQGYSVYRGHCEMKLSMPVTASAFISSGIIGGFCGMGGPPLVLWVNCQSWNSRQMRGFLQGCFAFANPVQLLMIWLVSDHAEVLEAMALAGLCIPALLLSSQVGLRLGAKINARRLRAIALIMLAILAVLSIIKPFIS